MRKLIVVTGAFGALGKVVVKHLASEGHSIAAIDLGEEAADSAAILTVGGVDLAEPADVEKAFELIRDLGIPLSGLVNLAGGFAWEEVAGGSLDTWDRMYRINLKTAVNACKAAIPLMSRNASIVNIGAFGAVNAGPGMAAYAASKAGVARLTEALAAELLSREIRVNALLPSIIDTPANRRDMPEADRDQWVTPQGLANVIAYFLSDAASALTGTLLPVARRETMT